MTKYFFLLSTLLIVFTLISLFFYLRITFSSVLINSVEHLNILKSNLKMKMISLNFMSLSGLWSSLLTKDLS